MVRYTDTIEPIAANVEKYNMIFEIYKNLYSALSTSRIYDQFDKLK